MTSWSVLLYWLSLLRRDKKLHIPAPNTTIHVGLVGMAPVFDTTEEEWVEYKECLDSYLLRDHLMLEWRTRNFSKLILLRADSHLCPSKVYGPIAAKTANKDSKWQQSRPDDSELILPRQLEGAVVVHIKRQHHKPRSGKAFIMKQNQSELQQYMLPLWQETWCG